MNSNFVFKILEYKEWFNKKEEYKGSLIDLKDGFIHLSTNNQIYETCKKHFFGKENLIVIYFKIKDLEISVLRNINELKLDISNTGQVLKKRLPVYPEFIKKEWLNRKILEKVNNIIDTDGFPKEHNEQ